MTIYSVIASDPRVIEFSESVYKVIHGRSGPAYYRKENGEPVSYRGVLNTWYPGLCPRTFERAWKLLAIETRDDQPPPLTKDQIKKNEQIHPPKKRRDLFSRTSRLHKTRVYGYIDEHEVEVVVGSKEEALAEIQRLNKLDAESRIKLSFRNGSTKTVCPYEELERLTAR
jgi:hypothetical protein